MLTWKTWIKMMQALEPHKRVRCMFFAGCAFLLFIPLYWMNWEEESEPIVAPLMRISAALASKPEKWEYDRSIHTFRIAYKDPGGHVVKRRVYVRKGRYDAANINAATPLFVEVENALSGPVVRSLSTSDEILYDSALRQYVNETINWKYLEGIVLFSLLGFASFVAAGVMHWQNRRQREQ
ncbi:hypothetical protein G7007_10680 [Pseudomonas entomophila]|uniref:hypothetical protein n=1 Tax=Pseudomonas entomophila TaxID=312306 RepID=UPI0015E29017|nr:hypothetical protein [Pseudomonas entomophila]MBA1193326.1 hypothetical protein [Pseudomonas entomophila]